MAASARIAARQLRRRQRKLACEPLEPRLCLAFELEVVAQTGTNFSSIQDMVSVNDLGQVSFVAKNQDALDAVYVGDADLAPKLVSFSPSPEPLRLYGRAAAINDAPQPQVAARDQTGSPHFFLRRWSADGDQSKRQDVAVSKNVFVVPEYEDFDSFLSWMDINDHNQVVFVGPDSSGGSNVHKLRVRTSVVDGAGGAAIEIGDFPSSAGLRPQISNTTEVVFRSPSGQSIFKTDRNSDKFRRIAGSQEGFTDVGRSPGISDDGRAIVFYGNHPHENTKGDGLAGGPGIFVSLLKPGADANGGAASRMLVRLAGRPAELGYDRFGDPVKLTDFATHSSASGSSTTDSRVGVAGSVSYKPGSSSLLMVTFLANDPEAGNRETLWRVEFTVSVDERGQMTVDVDKPEAVVRVGDEIRDKFGAIGEAADLEIYDPINNQGEIAFWTRLSNGGDAVVLSSKIKNPVLLLPGIVGTFAGDDYMHWLMNRGEHPSNLQIDPLAGVYNDIIQTLKNAGYRENEDLFVANYDWRVLPGPIDPANLSSYSLDWNFDGRITGLASHADNQTFEYGVDYLLYWLKLAVEEWQLRHPGVKLPAVDIIAHSTGGLVARTYIQSDLYGASFQASFGAAKLPKIDKFVMVGVPNRGAAKAWNPLHDNFNDDVAFKFVLSKVIKDAFEKQGAQPILGPDRVIAGETDPVTFIEHYIPTVRTLLATYNFFYYVNGTYPDNVNSRPDERNNLALDLNAGVDLGYSGDPNAFADLVGKLINVYGTNGKGTPVTVQEKVGPSTLFDPLYSFRDTLDRQPEADEVWYQQNTCNACGDETVPLDSSLGQFVGDSRVKLLPFTKGDNTSGKVGHTELLSNADVQAAILRELRQPVDRQKISTDKAKHGLTNMLNLLLDPVEGFLVDGQGRRLGYSTATGVLTEIPGSVYFGERDGMGWIFEPLAAPLRLELTGVGADHFAEVSGFGGVTEFGIDSRGFLAAGQAKNLPVVNNINHAPLALDDAVEASTTLLIDVLGNDSDPNGDPVQLVSLDTTSTVGTAVIAAGKVSYTPKPGSDLVDSFRYTISDGKGASATAEVRVNVPGRPRIVAVAPGDRAEVGSLPEITIDFSHPMDATTINQVGHYQVLHSQRGALPLASVSYQEQQGGYRATLTLAGDNLVPGNISVLVDGLALRTATGLTISGTPDSVVVLTYDRQEVTRIGRTDLGRFEAGSAEQLRGYDLPSQLASDDLNGDGIADVVHVSVATGELVLHLGRGNGQFQPPTGFRLPPVLPDVPARPEQVVLADWNGDGIADLLVLDNAYDETRFPNRRIHVYLNDGLGEFQVAPDTPILIGLNEHGTILGVADFTGDGLNDVAISGPAVDGSPSNYTAKGSVSIYGRDPVVGYSRRQLLSTTKAEWYPYQGVLADFNGDGRPDLVVATIGYYVFSPGTVIYLSTPNGLGPAIILDYDSIAGGQLVADDFTGDGKPDLAILHGYYSNSAGVSEGDVITTLIGDGQGGFTELPFQVLDRRGTGLVGSADLNRDGKRDLVLSAAPWPHNYVGNFPGLDHYSTWSLLGDGRGGFTPATPDPVPILPLHLGATGNMALADLNGDGFVDSVAAGTEIGVVRFQLNDKAGVLRGSPEAQFTGTLLEAFPEPQNRVLADVNGDGLTDVVASTGNYSMHLVVYLGTLDGRYEQRFLVPLPGAGGPGWLQPGDFNNDGKLDLAVAMGPNGIVIMLGLGDGRFVPGTPDPILAEGRVMTPSAPGQVADINRDGKLDVMVTVAHGWVFFLGDGQGGLTFSPNSFVQHFQHPEATPPLADLNGDGIVDFLSWAPNDDSSKLKMTLHRGVGNGTFTPGPVSLVPYDFPFLQYAVLDFNGDNRQDVLAYAYGETQMYVGDGTGRFQRLDGATQSLRDFLLLGGNAYRIRNLAVGDWNGDGHPDVGLTKNSGWISEINENMEVVALLLNDGTGRFGPAAIVPVGGYPGSLAAVKDNRWVASGAFQLVATLWPVKLTSPASIPQNQLELRGLGPANAIVRVLNGVVELARGTIGADGKWTVKLPTNLPTGRHILHLAATNDDGHLSAPTEFTLEVLPAAKPWQNPRHPLDVSDDGKVTNFDLTLILRELGSKGAYRLPALSATVRPPPYYDTFADDLLTVSDATQLLRFLGQRGGNSEPESDSADEITAEPLWALDPNAIDAIWGELATWNPHRRFHRLWRR